MEWARNRKEVGRVAFMFWLVRGGRGWGPPEGDGSCGWARRWKNSVRWTEKTPLNPTVKPESLSLTWSAEEEEQRSRRRATTRQGGSRLSVGQSFQENPTPPFWPSLCRQWVCRRDTCRLMNDESQVSQRWISAAEPLKSLTAHRGLSTGGRIWPCAVVTPQQWLSCKSAGKLPIPEKMVPAGWNSSYAGDSLPPNVDKTTVVMFKIWMRN